MKIFQNRQKVAKTLHFGRHLNGRPGGEFILYHTLRNLSREKLHKNQQNFSPIIVQNDEQFLLLSFSIYGIISVLGKRGNKNG